GGGRGAGARPPQAVDHGAGTGGGRDARGGRALGDPARSLAAQLEHEARQSARRLARIAITAAHRLTDGVPRLFVDADRHPLGHCDFGRLHPFVTLAQFFRRRLVAAQEVAGPAPKAIDPLIVGVFRRAADQRAVLDLFAVLVLGPGVAALAERHFVPLFGLVVVARLGELLAVPDFLHALLEHVAHVGSTHAVEAAQAHAAVVVHRHRLVDHGA